MQVPDDAVKARVEDGWVWLDGEVDWQYQSAASERAVRNLMGVRGVSNLIRIKKLPLATDVKTRIENAFKRHVNLDSTRDSRRDDRRPCNAQGNRSLVGGASRGRIRCVVGAGCDESGRPALRARLSRHQRRICSSVAGRPAGSRRRKRCGATLNSRSIHDSNRPCSTRLPREGSLLPAEIGVGVRDGVVSLMGEVDSLMKRTRAERTVESMPGVRSSRQRHYRSLGWRPTTN